MELSHNELRQLQLLQLKILKEVHRICEKHSIKYFLSYGTLIGAVRHKGFIPWDDDIDIGMLREDYNKFCIVYQNDLSEEFFFQTMETDPGYPYIYGKIILTKTVFVEKTISKCKCKSGVFIDIFPYDCMPNERYKQLIKRIQVTIFTRAVFIKKRRKLYFPKSKRLFLLSLVFFSILFSFLPSSILYSLLSHAITKYSSLVKNKGCIVANFCSDPTNNKTNIENLKFTKLTKFEDDLFYIPQNYDAVLSSQYGDYMKLPPLEERTPCHEVIEYNFQTN